MTQEREPTREMPDEPRELAQAIFRAADRKKGKEKPAPKKAKPPGKRT